MTTLRQDDGLDTPSVKKFESSLSTSGLTHCRLNLNFDGGVPPRPNRIEWTFAAVTVFDEQPNTSCKKQYGWSIAAIESRRLLSSAWEVSLPTELAASVLLLKCSGVFSPVGVILESFKELPIAILPFNLAILFLFSRFFFFDRRLLIFIDQ